MPGHTPNELNSVPLKFNVHLALQNVTIFGNGVFADIIN